MAQLRKTSNPETHSNNHGLSLLSCPYRKRTMIFILSMLTTCTTFYIYQSGMFPMSFKMSKITSSACLVPDYDPFDSSVKQFYQKRTHFQCDASRSFIDIVNENTIEVDQEALEIHYKRNVSKCKYWAVVRNPNPGKNPDNRVIFKEKADSVFNINVTVQDEFVKVSCYDDKNNSFYTDYRALILKKPEVEARCPGSSKGKLSVLIFGIDSVSKLNFLRHFPKTLMFLKEHNAIDLKSYNKVGRGTIDNMYPLLTGKFLEKFRSSGRNSTFDDAELIWKKFSAKGYRTLFMEDAPDWGMFNYEKIGFIKAPTDYYYRPFANVLETSDIRRKSKHHCIGSEMEFKFVLDWGKRFAETFKDRLYFQMTFLTRISHNELNYAGYADEPSYEFFKALEDSNSLNNTFLFFLSDHGIRYGDIRKTKIGKMEENTPFMYLLPPKWFQKVHPEIWRNLQINQNRLTTVFDIHKTLKTILDYPNFSSRVPASLEGLGTSLFKEVSASRTCEKVHIPENFCSCDTFSRFESISEKLKTKLTSAALDKISELLRENFDKCHKLRLREIYSVQKKILKTNSEIDVYQVSFSVTPGTAQFEATVKVNVSAYDVVGDISRINRYYNQSHCVHTRALKSFCLCK